MKQIGVSLLGMALISVLSFCGKKKSDDETPATTTNSVPSSTLSITCGGKACIGTEGK